MNKNKEIFKQQLSQNKLEIFINYLKFKTLIFHSYILFFFNIINQKHYNKMRKQQQPEPINRQVQNNISQEQQSSAYSSQDQNAYLLTQKVEQKLLETVARLKSRDPSLYKTQKPIFEDIDFQQQANQQTNKKDLKGKKQTQKNNNTQKKFTYKDMLIGKGKKLNDKQTQNKNQDQSSQQQSSQQQQQEDLPPAMQQKKAKNKFKQALNKQTHILENNNEGQAEDDLFTIKRKLKKQENIPDKNKKGSRSHQQNDQAQTQTQKFQQLTKKMKPQTKSLIKSVWQNEQNMDHTDLFLRDYILNKKWLSTKHNLSTDPKSTLTLNNKNEFENIDEEDEERSLQMDEFEAEYNFRFQEPDGDKIMQYPRKIKQSLRIKPQTRKQKRKKGQQRKRQQQKVFREQAQKKKTQLKNKIIQMVRKEGEGQGQHQDQNQNEDYQYNDEQNNNQQQQYDQQNNMQAQQQAEQQQQPYNPQQQAQFQHDWFFCDDCGKPFQQQQTNFVCESCQDYMLCGQCYQLIQHKHPLKEGIVPQGFGAPRKEMRKVKGVLGKLLPCKRCRRKIPSTLKHYEYKDRSQNVELLCEPCYEQSPLNIKKKFSIAKLELNKNKIQQILQKDPQRVKQLTNSKQIQQIVDQYLKYQFQDVLSGGFKTKFKYINVKAEDYGLSDEQILFGDDKQLNNYISVKKLAPYLDRKLKLRNNIYNKKVQTINRSVNRNRQLISTQQSQQQISRKLKKTRTIQKMIRRTEVMKKRRQTKLKIINLSSKQDEKKMYVPSSRLESYGVKMADDGENNVGGSGGYNNGTGYRHGQQQFGKSGGYSNNSNSNRNYNNNNNVQQNSYNNKQNNNNNSNAPTNSKVMN